MIFEVSIDKVPGDVFHVVVKYNGGAMVDKVFLTAEAAFQVVQDATRIARLRTELAGQKEEAK